MAKDLNLLDTRKVLSGTVGRGNRLVVVRKRPDDRGGQLGAVGRSGPRMRNGDPVSRVSYRGAT